METIGTLTIGTLRIGLGKVCLLSCADAHDENAEKSQVPSLNNSFLSAGPMGPH